MNKIEIVKAFQNLMSQSDKTQAFDMIDDNAIWHSDEICAPWSGIHKGKENIIRHFNAISGTTINFSRQAHEFIEKNDLVIELGSLSCILRKTNQPFNTEYVCLYKVRDGKIYSYRIFEDSLKLHAAYFPEKHTTAKSLQSNHITIAALVSDNSAHDYILNLLEDKGLAIQRYNNIEQLKNGINENSRVIVLASNELCTPLWKENEQLQHNIKAIVLLHPNGLANFEQQTVSFPCFIIYPTKTTLTSIALIQSIKRPRPDLVQYINDDIVDLFPELLQFITQFSVKDNIQLATIVSNDEIQAQLPAPYPGAIRVIENEDCIIGFVMPGNYPSFPHINYMNELHYVIQGEAMFRHGQQAVKKIQSGDLVFVNAFELHEWSNYSNDFLLMYVQYKGKFL